MQIATPEQIETIVRDAAGRHFPGGQADQVVSQPDVASTGEGAVRILIVLDDAALRPERDPDFLSVLTDIWGHLEQLGDERIPILSYATPAELAEDDDSEY